MKLKNKLLQNLYKISSGKYYITYMQLYCQIAN